MKNQLTKQFWIIIKNNDYKQLNNNLLINNESNSEPNKDIIYVKDFKTNQIWENFAENTLAKDKKEN